MHRLVTKQLLYKIYEHVKIICKAKLTKHLWKVTEHLSAWDTWRKAHAKWNKMTRQINKKRNRCQGKSLKAGLYKHDQEMLLPQQLRPGFIQWIRIAPVFSRSPRGQGLTQQNIDLSNFLSNQHSQITISKASYIGETFRHWTIRIKYCLKKDRSSPAFKAYTGKVS